MRRNVDLSDISDGKLYGDNDMVKADCRGCAGCSDCCRGMGDTILLDPYDVWRLTTGLGKAFADFLDREIELGVADGCILPHMRMTGARESCAFLDGEGRCSVHALRPGICRLFPLGRYYENGAFQYFLQTGECSASRSKIKVSRWIDTPDQRRYREFVTAWHYLLIDAQNCMQKKQDDMFQKELNMLLLKTFFLTPYDGKTDFYGQFEKRKEDFYALTLGNCQKLCGDRDS